MNTQMPVFYIHVCVCVCVCVIQVREKIKPTPQSSTAELCEVQQWQETMVRLGGTCSSCHKGYPTVQQQRNK